MLSRTAQYAVKAMIELARLRDGELGCAACIAGRTGAPVNYLSKLLKLLAQQGLLESRKGLGGGFHLARPAREITLFDIAEPIDHVSRMSSCFFGDADCRQVPRCAAHDGWQAVRDPFLGFLRNTTLEQLRDSK